MPDLQKGDFHLHNISSRIPTALRWEKLVNKVGFLPFLWKQGNWHVGLIRPKARRQEGALLDFQPVRGTLERDEETFAAALRELAEEAGIEATELKTDIFDLGAVLYPGSKDGPSGIYWYAGATDNAGALQATQDSDDVAWVAVADIRKHSAIKASYKPLLMEVWAVLEREIQITY